MLRTPEPDERAGGAPIRLPDPDASPEVFVDGRPIMPDRAGGRIPSGSVPDPVGADDGGTEPTPIFEAERSPGRSVDEIIAEHLVPAEPEKGPARFLRRVAGVDEEVLDWVPEERPRYTRLGAIVLNTGVMAGISLLAALGHVIEAPVPVLLGIACFWAFLVVSLDGWLIASTHGAIGPFRLVKFIPRLLISLLLGFVIAEPIVLWVFGPAVNRQVQQTRDDAVGQAVTMWTRCNPPSGLRVEDEECADGGWVITITGAASPQARLEERKTLLTQRDQAQERLAADTAAWDRLNDLARAECNGDPGTGLSGVRGEGPNCDRDRQEADRFRQDRQLDKQQQAVAALNRKLAAATAKVRRAAADYGAAVQKAIEQHRIDQEQQDQQQEVGLLEQSAALGELSRSSPFVFSAQWLLRLLLIALDCMPVFVKMVGGVTTYDRFVHMRLVMRERVHDGDVGATELRYRHQQHLREEMLNGELRAIRAQRLEQERSEIDNLISRFRARRLRGTVGGDPA